MFTYNLKLLEFVEVYLYKLGKTVLLLYNDRHPLCGWRFFQIS